MSRLARGAELIGMPVVTLETAEAAGEVRDVLVDPARSRVVGYTLRGAGLLSSPLLGILPAEQVHAIGRDALMITSQAAIVGQREGMSASLDDQQEVVGKEIVTRSGVSLGSVNDVVLEIEGSIAHVVGFEIEREDGATVIVPVPESVPLSGEALLLPDEVERQAVNGLNGFREMLERSGVSHSGAGA